MEALACVVVPHPCGYREESEGAVVGFLLNGHLQRVVGRWLAIDDDVNLAHHFLVFGNVPRHAASGGKKHEKHHTDSFHHLHSAVSIVFCHHSQVGSLSVYLTVDSRSVVASDIEHDAVFVVVFRDVDVHNSLIIKLQNFECLATIADEIDSCQWND